MIIHEANRLSRIGEYYFSGKLREIRAMVERGIPVINLGIGSPDMMPSPETIEALHHSASKSGHHGYQPYQGIPELRKAMALWYAETYGVHVDGINEILPLIGSKEGVNYVMQAFIDPGDVVLVPDPGYPSYLSSAYLAGGEPVSYSLDEKNNWAPDWDSLTPELLERAKLWFIGYPNMPTGAAGSQELFSHVLDLARRYHILVVNDNPYSLILNEDQPVSIHQTPGSMDLALELNSLSKSHNMAGWRVGMMVGRADYLQTVLKVKSNVDSGMFRGIQDAAIAALKNSDEWHEERNRTYAGRRQLALAILDQLGCRTEPHQTGMFLWSKIPDTYKDVEDLTEKVLHEANVFITPGFIFGNNGTRYVRISLCSPESDFREALARIKRAGI